MRYFGLILGTLMLLAGCEVPSNDPMYSPRDTVYPLVVVATSKQDATMYRMFSSGSAVVIAPGYALTASHVVESVHELDEHKATVNVGIEILVDHKRIDVEVIKSDPRVDLALVKGDFACPCATIYALPEPLKVDTEVSSIGYPLFKIYGIQIRTDGRYQGEITSSDDTKVRHLVTTAEAAWGSSGGGVFVRVKNRWHLIGIMKGIGAAPSEPHAIQHHWLVFSSPPDAVRAFLRDTFTKKR